MIIYDNPLEPPLVGEIYKELNHWDEIAISCNLCTTNL